MRRIFTLLCCLVILLLTGCAFNQSYTKVDLSDIEQMNIGAEMPNLLYGDENIAIMQGTFGLLVYSLDDSMVTDRISYDQLEKLDIFMLVAGVSKDGEKIYIGNVDDWISEPHFMYEYNIKSRKMKTLTQQNVDVFNPTSVAPGYSEQYDKYFDLHYLISETIVKLEDSFMYLRADTDWRMKSLQLVICQYKDASNEIKNIF